MNNVENILKLYSIIKLITETNSQIFYLLTLNYKSVIQLLSTQTSKIIDS